VALRQSTSTSSRGGSRTSSSTRGGCGRLILHSRASRLRVCLAAIWAASAGRCGLLSLGSVGGPGYQPVAWFAAVADWGAGSGWRSGRRGRVCGPVTWLAAMARWRGGLGWRGGRGCRRGRVCGPVSWFAAVVC